MPPPPRRPPRPPDANRRKLLLAGAFAAANALVVPRLGSGGSGAGTTAVQVGREPGDLAAATTPVRLEGAAEPPPPGHRYGTVIRGGRVIDPDSGFDGLADVGIDGGTITQISTDPLDGVEVIDATGLVVAPGFIDVLSFEPNETGVWFKVADGVTTNLGMHGLNAEAADFFATHEGALPLHYGGAFDNAWYRGLVMDVGVEDEASPDEVARLADWLRRDAADGYIGLSFETEYTPGVSFEEVRRLCAVAAELGLPAFFHVRYSDPDPPGTNAEALEEVLRAARETGAGVHVDHITSTGGTHTMEASIGALEAARDEGLAVTACMYPYDFWATNLGSTRFADGWQERFRISYDDLQIAGTGEVLTEDSFAAARAENLRAVAHAIPEADVRYGLQVPWMLVGSDAILEPGANNHPRAAGCFARTLGRYSREEGVIELPDALARMTILPARRLEGAAPALRRKGRLQIGADADITVFDPATVVDRASVEDPAQESEGMRWVLVMGQVVRGPDGNRTDVRPGQPIRAELA